MYLQQNYVSSNWICIAFWICDEFICQTADFSKCYLSSIVGLRPAHLWSTLFTWQSCYVKIYLSVHSGMIFFCLGWYCWNRGSMNDHSNINNRQENSSDERRGENAYILAIINDNTTRGTLGTREETHRTTHACRGDERCSGNTTPTLSLFVSAHSKTSKIHG
jgi:hypothetical protein